MGVCGSSWRRSGLHKLHHHLGVHWNKSWAAPGARRPLVSLSGILNHLCNLLCSPGILFKCASLRPLPAPRPSRDRSPTNSDLENTTPGSWWSSPWSSCSPCPGERYYIRYNNTISGNHVQPTHRSLRTALLRHEALRGQAQPRLEQPPLQDWPRSPQVCDPLRHLRSRHAAVLHDDSVCYQESQVTILWDWTLLHSIIFQGLKSWSEPPL